MQRLGVAALVLALVGFLAGCNGVFAVSTNGNGSAFITTSGTVSIVQLTFSSDGTQITIVTLLDGGSSQTINFCGNAVPRFPADTFVTVDFTHNGPCDTLVHVR